MLWLMSQGLLYGLLSLGVMFSYKILDVADLTVDGSYPLGVVVSSMCMLSGMHPLWALFFSLLAGLLSGMMTGILHVKLHISSLLSGILMMTGLYSVNLVIAKGQSNIPLFNEYTLFKMKSLSFLPAKYRELLVLMLITIVFVVWVEWFLQTRLGYLLKLVGSNEAMIGDLGHDHQKLKIFGLALGNGLAAFAGGLAASLNGYFDISLGTGMVVLGLSSILLGDTLGKKYLPFISLRVVLGAILYQMMIAFALRLNMPPHFLKLSTVLIFVLALSLQKRQSRKALKTC